jgi:hypothetical protein
MFSRFRQAQLRGLLFVGALLGTNAKATTYVFEFDGQMLNSYGSIFFFETVTGSFVIDDTLPVGQELVSMRVVHETKGTVYTTGQSLQMLNDYFGVSDLIRYFGNAPAQGSLGTVDSQGGITIQLSGPIDVLDSNDLVTDVNVLNQLLGFSQPGEGVQLCFPDDNFPYTSVTCDATITDIRIANPIAEIEVNGGNPLHLHHDGGNSLPDDPINVTVFGAQIAQGDPIDFDPTLIDVVTVSFGPSQAGDADASMVVSDVDGDGISDATFDFLTSATGYECYQLQTTGLITGEALAIPFSGATSISEDCSASCH